MKQAQAYRHAKNMLIPNMYYRKDPGDRWIEDHAKLRSWGYLRDSQEFARINHHDGVPLLQSRQSLFPDS